MEEDSKKFRLGPAGLIAQQVATMVWWRRACCACVVSVHQGVVFGCGDDGGSLRDPWPPVALAW